ncbi:hypothetical protein B0O99DRAFT_687377 [Bisporella sp. PMI_857]|nr:hypothetical protein B0O99DRAFT_687377 [Bisporella sp. PMI_857]
MSTNKIVEDDPNYMKETYVGSIGAVRCHVCKLRGNGLTDPDSNWKLWNADMKVYRDSSGADLENEVFASLEEKELARMERTRKAMIWFSVSEKLREEHLVDMGGRDKTSADVMKRLHERFAPPGTKFQPLDELVLTKEMKRNLRRREAQTEAETSKRKG